MIEGSTRSREAMRPGAEMRDVVEAGLNEAASDPEVYGRWMRTPGSWCRAAVGTRSPVSGWTTTAIGFAGLRHGD
jgi:hypothetical protein